MAFTSIRLKEFMDDLLTAKEVKGILKVSLPCVYKMAARRQIPSVKWSAPVENGKRPKTTTRFKRSDVQAFIEDHYRGSDSESGDTP